MHPGPLHFTTFVQASRRKHEDQATYRISAYTGQRGSGMSISNQGGAFGLGRSKCKGIKSHAVRLYGQLRRHLYIEWIVHDIVINW